MKKICDRKRLDPYHPQDLIDYFLTQGLTPSKIKNTQP